MDSKINITKCKIINHKINDIIYIFHQIQLKQSNYIHKWLLSNKLLNTYLTSKIINKIFENTSFKTKKYNQHLTKQAHKLRYIIFIINGNVKIEKYLIALPEKKKVEFIVDNINDTYSPFIGTEIINNSKTYIFTTRVISKRVEYLLLNIDKLYLLFQSIEIQQWFLNRFYELKAMFYIETQKYYENHAIHTMLLDFRGLSLQNSV